MTTAVRTIDRDPRAPDAIRRRRGPDLRLVPSAATAWLAVAVAIHIRGMSTVVVCGVIAILFTIFRWQLNSRARLLWRPQLDAALRSAHVAVVIATLAAAGVTVRMWLIDRHPVMRTLADGSGVYRGQARISGGLKILPNGTWKLPVKIPCLGEVPLFVNADHQTEQLNEAQPGTMIHIAARLRESAQADLVPATLSSSREVEVSGEPTGIYAVTSPLRSGIRLMSQHGVCEWLGDQRWFGDAATLLPGILIGDTSTMPTDTRQDFLATGLSHLTAVSGLHVAIVASSVMILATMLGAHRKTRLWAIVVTIAAFAVVVGPEPSIVRAGTMGIVGVVAVMSSRWSDSISAMSLAVLLIVFIAPGISVRFGLVLSVVATLAIIAASPPLGRWLILGRKKLTTSRWDRQPRAFEAMILRALAVASVADFATQPIIVLMVGSISPTAVPANLLVGLAIVPLMVIGLVAAVVGTPLIFWEYQRT